MNNKHIIQNTNVPFDEIFVPSKGIFYKNKKDSFLVKYLTAKEENALTSPSLVESGKAVDLVLSSCILDWDGDAKDMLIGDRDAFFIYLRSTAYGDKINFEYVCSNCGEKTECNIFLSQLEMKEYEDIPDENGEFSYKLPMMRIKINEEEEEREVFIKFSPRTVGDEIEINRLTKLNKKNVKGIEVDSSIEARYITQIKSINGIKDKNFIKTIIKRMPISDSSNLRKYMDDIEPGIDNVIKSNCTSCQHLNQNMIPMGQNFLNLGEEYRKNMMDEIFLVSYYGKGGHTREDLYNMPIYERRWVMERISEEVEKRNKAEKAAETKARSQAKSKGARI